MQGQISTLRVLKQRGIFPFGLHEHWQKKCRKTRLLLSHRTSVCSNRLPYSAAAPPIAPRISCVLPIVHCQMPNETHTLFFHYSKKYLLFRITVKIFIFFCFAAIGSILVTPAGDPCCTLEQGETSGCHRKQVLGVLCSGWEIKWAILENWSVYLWMDAQPSTSTVDVRRRQICYSS